MVAAFGSRPCGVIAAERSPAPLIVGLRARDGVDGAAEPRQTRAPSIVSLARGSSAVRGPVPSHGGAANALPVADDAWRIGGIQQCVHPAAPVRRRTPCAGCGDGTPYDATAPPSAPIARA